jgi:hypothetical protein
MDLPWEVKPPKITRSPSFSLGHLEKYSLEAGRSAIEVAVVSVSGLMGAGLSSRLFEAATRAIGKTI